MSDLPSGWTACKLDDLAKDVTYGYTASSTDEPVGPRMLRITDIQDNQVDWKSVPYCKISAEDISKYRLQDGDLVFARTGATVGKSYRITGEIPEAVFASYLIRVRFAFDGMSRYLTYFFRSEAYWRQVTEFSAGIGQPNVNGTKLRNLVVPLAPLAEQVRMADKLDAAFVRIDACRARLEKVPLILKRFREAVLEAAVSGKLTEEWRQEQRAESVFESAGDELSNLCVQDRVITYGVIKLGEESPGGVPCLRTSNVRWLRVDTEGMKRIAPSLSAEYSRTVLNGSEVLVNVRGTLGGVAAATPEMRGWNVSREVAVVPANPHRIDAQYLALWIGSARSQRWLRKVEKGVAYTGINIEDLRRLPVSVPSLPEQHEIVRRVGELFTFADTLSGRYDFASVLVEKLTPSLLSKAFRGELVPQDPTDEPASVLLERIRKGRETELKRERRGKKERAETVKAARKTKATDGGRRSKVAARAGRVSARRGRSR